MLELLSEPLYVLAAVQLRFRLRALVDTAAIVAKSAMTVALLQLTALPPALALSWAQMAFAAVTLVCYGAAYAQELPSWLINQDGSAAAVCRQQGVTASNQQGGSGAASSAAADAAVLHSDIRQRKLAQQQDVPAEQTEISHTPAGVQERLLHGPTLWLCGSFSLQVWAGSHATQSSARWQLTDSKGVKQSGASFTGCRETGAGGGFQDGHGGPPERLQSGKCRFEQAEHPQCRRMDSRS
jgi:Rft protein